MKLSPVGATARLNAWTKYFDDITFGQHDCYTHQQIRDYFAAIQSWTALEGFVDAASELGYTFADTSTATRTETVKETLYGL